MQDRKTPLEMLETTPITQLSVGKTSFRRSLAQKGYRNIIEVLNLTAAQIDQSFSLDEACTIESLQASYTRDPETFAKNALEKFSHPHVGHSLTMSAQIPHALNEAHGYTPRTSRLSSTQTDPYSYLHLPFVIKLSQFEQKAKETLDDLGDAQDNVIVYQCFDVFSTDFKEIDENFQLLFDHFEYRPQYALNFIEKFLVNIFLVYVADRARTFHEQRGFWTQFFPTIHFRQSNNDARTAFKQLFYTNLQRKGMPVYQADENARHFYLTALLHGGLSKSSWGSLWKTSILPLAHSIRALGNGSQIDIDDRSVLQTVLDESNVYTPPRTELELLRKAPVALAAPLLGSALRVGMQIESARKTGTGLTMLTSYGLPGIAIEALMDIETRRAGDGDNGSADRSSRCEIIALPKADLRLDVERGNVALHWDRQPFPLSQSARRIDYYVHGEKRLEQHFHYGIDKCVLDDARIEVAPLPQYEVALKLMERDERSGEWREIASLEQNFERLNPGCFEFIENSKGIFKLRRPNNRITRTRSIAYILDDGLGIDPGPGMEFLESYESQGAWGSTTIEIYRVSPGSSGSIIAIGENGSRERIAVWQENYRSSIDKTGVLGTTLDGIDLYGFIPDENEENIGLPSFYIEAFDGRSALDDLDIECKCDGEHVSIKREILWEDLGADDTKGARIKLSPTESSHFYFHRHINHCIVEARQRPAQGSLVFRYKFCVAPIQDFHLESITLKDYELNSVYTFTSAESMFVIDETGTIRRPDESGRFFFSTPLSSATLRVRIVSSRTAKSTDALLDLAALEIAIPRRLIDRARRRPLCLADAQAGYAEGLCDVKVGNWSQSRAVLVQLGDIPLYFRELPRPTTGNFSVFSDTHVFLPSTRRDMRDLPLSICVFYGYRRSEGKLVPAHARAEMLPCREGLGFTTWSIRFDSAGRAFVNLNAPLACDAEVVIQRVRPHGTEWRDKPFRHVAHEGDHRVPLPRGITTALQGHRVFEMSFTPLDEFADIFDDDEEGDATSLNDSTATFILKGIDHHGK